VTYIFLWLYVIDISLLILHEMDSAYWKEWELFCLPGGITGFLLFHFLLHIIGLYGLVLVWQAQPAGFILSLMIAATGIFAFCIYTNFLRQGRNEFNAAISKLVLTTTLGISILQIVVTMQLPQKWLVMNDMASSCNGGVSIYHHAWSLLYQLLS
jgi:hypothetical protein